MNGPKGKEPFDESETETRERFLNSEGRGELV